MSANDTAIQVIHWAIEGSSDSLPQGDLHHLHTLQAPGASLKQALAALVAITAARLHLSDPPLQDKHPISADNAVFAAALGALHQPQFAYTLLAKGLSVPQWPVDCLARHGLANRILALFYRNSGLSSELINACLLASPLTALIYRPLQGQQSLLLNLCQQWLADPYARCWLRLTLAHPSEHADIRYWRSELLHRLLNAESIVDNAEFVLDVYETSMIFYAETLQLQVQQARYRILNGDQKDETPLRDALSVAYWWQPLMQLEQRDPGALRSRRYLGYAYREGIALCRQVQRLSGDLPRLNGEQP